MTPPVVPWVVGPKLAIARSIALLLAEERGKAWDRLKPAHRAAFIAEAIAHVDRMVADGGVISFDHEWREPIRKN